MIIGVFRYFQSVAECPDLLLMFSLLQIKNFYAVCWTLFQYLPASWFLIVEHHLLLGCLSICRQSFSVCQQVGYRWLSFIQWLSKGFRGFRNHFLYHRKSFPQKTCCLQCFFPELIESSSHSFLTPLFPLTR